MKIAFNVKGFLDRRSEDLHARHDIIEERRFALRLERNHKERDRLIRARQLRDAALPALLRRQAG